MEEGNTVPTSKDVAAAAGVSQSTVSYVMSGKRPISEKTRLRVEAAIEQLTYRPNAGARALASRKSQVIGLVIPITPDSHLSLMDFIAVIAAIARRHDHDVLLVTDEEGNQGLERVVGQQLCDGLILMQVHAEDERIPVVRKLRVPAVFIGIPNDSAGLNCIDADFARAGELCVEEMSQAGHTSGAIIGWRPPVDGRSKLNYVERFLGGAKAAAQRLGVTLDHVPTGTDRPSIEAAVDACIAGSDGRPAFVSPDMTTVELLPWILRERGLEPGRDASVIGVGATTGAMVELQESTVVDLQPRLVSRRAVEILFSLMTADSPDTGGTLELIPPLVTHRHGAAGHSAPARRSSA
jgi:DNA-binding LacI/PurR family transcriptional regulator